MNKKLLRVLFVIAGIYDGVLGIAFLFFSSNIFTYFEVTEPNHIGYVQFPALLLVIFAALFFNIAIDPVKNRNLIPYGIGLKIAYCSVVFGNHLISDSIPWMWLPWAWVDLVFLLAFIWALAATRKSA